MDREVQLLIVLFLNCASRRLDGVVFECGCDIRWIQLWLQRGEAGLHTQELYCKKDASKIRLHNMYIHNCGKWEKREEEEEMREAVWTAFKGGRDKRNQKMEDRGGVAKKRMAEEWKGLKVGWGRETRSRQMCRGGRERRCDRVQRVNLMWGAVCWFWQTL